MFVDDPSQLIDPLESAWPEYIERGDELLREAEASVVQWRFARDHMYLPDHPSYQTIDTRAVDGYWTARPLQWFEYVDDESVRVQHGFDAEGRLVIARRRHFTTFIKFGDTFYDLLRASLDAETGLWLTAEKERKGIRAGGVERCLIGDLGQIVAKIRLYNEFIEPEHHNRTTEVFAWHGNRVTESFRQRFDLGHEMPVWARDLTPEQQAGMYRQANDRVREFMSGRELLKYDYGPDGRLTKAEAFDGETGTRRATLYTFDPSDTIENVSAELVRVLGKALVKTLKGRKELRPLRRVALVYSAEHAHCGLPTSVILAAKGDGDINPLDREGYPHRAPWPPGGRTEQKIESLHRRLLVVVEGAADYAEQLAPLPYREVLWKTSRAVYDALAKSKRIVTEDFAVFPLDDHGDVDPREDVCESLPSSAADQVLGEC